MKFWGWIVFVFLAIAAMTVMHEVTHMVIFNSYAIPTRFGIDWHSVYVEPYNYSYISEQEWSDINVTQNNAEIVGYMFIMFTALMIMCFMVIDQTLQEKR